MSEEQKDNLVQLDDFRPHITIVDPKTTTGYVIPLEIFKKIQREEITFDELLEENDWEIILRVLIGVAIETLEKRKEETNV